ncbi:hypothetical protein HYDPIDRAFT_170352 [Hydnomerulius pinastri MD-312]|uniref:Uncharacterized protein n=1 Tax=Hydnomerulius pinastri MD-312 TaxID=994086 RepID=A0A0C9W2M6_9AGAM|nr:hypothetical protein HYDPIDRAFT_170352 [Hydnomerulius pinastri MD-312]
MDANTCGSQVKFPSFGESFARDNVPNFRRQLPSNGEPPALESLLRILSAHLGSQAKSCTIQFKPALLFSICDVLQYDHGLAESRSASLLPSVLSTLKPWRVLDPSCRHTSEALQNLASELAEIANTGRQSSFHVDTDPTSFGPPRLMVKWAGSNPVDEDDYHMPSQPHVPEQPEQPERSCPATPETSELSSHVANSPSCTANTAASQRRESGVIFRRCSACSRHRVPFPSAPHTPRIPSLEYTAPPNDPYVLPLCPQPLSVTQTRKRTRLAKAVTSASHRKEVDENTPPPFIPVGVDADFKFPRRRTALPNSSTITSLPSCATSSASASSHSMTGILQYSRIPNRKREINIDAATYNPRVASADLRLYACSSMSTSPSDLRPPPRAQSLSHIPVPSQDFQQMSMGPKHTTDRTLSRSIRGPDRRFPSGGPPLPIMNVTKLPASSPRLSKPRSPNPSVRLPSAARPPSSKPRSISGDAIQKQSGQTGSRRQTSYGSRPTSTLLQPRQWQP